jgi:N-acetylmuramoyl-L-alanine amidase
MNLCDIVIDPGHGGDMAAGHSSPIGVQGPGGTLEKDVTLRLAQRLVDALGSTARLTRDGDVNLTLAARADIARSACARAFVSLHANSGRPGERGAEAWVHDRASMASKGLAARLLAALGALPNVPPARGVKTGQMAVLTPESLAPETAACLLEVDFLSDPDGERRLDDDNAVGAIAAALASALRDQVRATPSLPATPLSLPARRPASAPAPARAQIQYSSVRGNNNAQRNGFGQTHGQHELYGFQRGARALDESNNPQAQPKEPPGDLAFVSRRGDGSYGPGEISVVPVDTSDSWPKARKAFLVRWTEANVGNGPMGQYTTKCWITDDNAPDTAGSVFEKEIPSDGLGTHATVDREVRVDPQGPGHYTIHVSLNTSHAEEGPPGFYANNENTYGIILDY